MLFLAAVVIIAGVTTTQAEAACVVRGNYYSDAECEYVKPNKRVTAAPYTYSYNNAYNYNYNSPEHIASLEAQVRQLLVLLQQLQSMQQYHNYYVTDPVYYDGNSQVDVVTRSARDIEDDRATLRGEVDFNNEDEATVYFRYGTSATNLSRETVHIVLDEDDDDEEFTQRIQNLRRDETYYFRAVAEDENGRRDYGNILSFETDDRYSSRDDDEPEIDVNEADDVDEDSAELSGDVDMNDFNNGIVFFVWGEDEDQVEDIEDDYDEYSDIDEDGEDLQKYRVDSDLDGNAYYYANIYGLDDNTDHYFNLCVEYEDEDDDPVITCGDMEEFTTDRD